VQPTIREAPTGVWHSLTTQYCLLAFGVAFAVSAAISGGNLIGHGSDGAQIDVTRPLSPASSVPNAGESPLTTYYVVGTQERANELATEIQIAADATHPVRVMVVDSPEKQAQLGVMVAELMAIQIQNGTLAAAVIDLRWAANGYPEQQAANKQESP